MGVGVFAIGDVLGTGPTEGLGGDVGDFHDGVPC